jgi:hypothetical protein
MNFIFNEFFFIGSSGADELKIGPLLFTLYKNIVLEHMWIPHSILGHFLDRWFMTWQAEN